MNIPRKELKCRAGRARLCGEGHSFEKRQVLFKKKTKNMYMSVCVACLCHSVPACMWQSEVNLLKSVLSFYYMVPGEPTWITSKHLYSFAQDFF